MRRTSAFTTNAEHIRAISNSDGLLIVRKRSIYSGDDYKTENNNDEIKDEQITPSPIPKRKQANIPFLPQFQPKVIRFLSDTRRKAHIVQSTNQTQEKNYLLRYAVRRNDWERVQRILQNDDVNINFANDRGITALHEAAIDCSCACVKTLVDSGADLNQTDNEGFTALDYAVWGGDFDCAALLSKHGASESRIRDGLRKERIQANDRGITALHEAAIDCSCACVKTLVDSGADLNQTDNEGFTALDYAVWGGDFDCAALLLKHGASESRIRDGLRKGF